MNFTIELRNKVTGRAVNLDGKQAVADFLAGLDKSEWEGFLCLGELPTPTHLVSADPVAPEAADILSAPVPTIDLSHLVIGEPVLAQMDAAVAQPLVDALQPLVATDAAPLAQGASDTYLPADTQADSGVQP